MLVALGEMSWNIWYLLLSEVCVNHGTSLALSRFNWSWQSTHPKNMDDDIPAYFQLVQLL